MSSVFPVPVNEAWQTPGWTAQNQAYPVPPGNNFLFPDDVDLVTLTGHFRDGDGGLANGWFDVDNQGVVLLHATSKESIAPIKFRTEIRYGTFSITLPATDTATLANSVGGSWYYHMRVSIAGKLYKEYWNVTLPLANTTPDFYDITGVTTAPTNTTPVVIIDGGGA